MELTEAKALRLLQQGSAEALKWFMGKYTPYVSTIIYNIIGSAMTSADVEEVASDVFFALWENADKVNSGSVRGYLGAVARNKAKNKFREAGFDRFRFFYPYPDYKFPMSIYSDEYLPKTGELRQNLENFDRSRMMLFDEARALDSIIKAGLFPLFSNSYFIELER